MATPVEQATYHVPEAGTYSNYLSASFNFRRDITKGGYGDHSRHYENLPILAQEIGLRIDTDIPTRHGTWHIYEGLDLAIPNFPEGDTRVNEALALYERDGDLTNAILRLQAEERQEPFTIEDLADDLEAFTKYYVERPRLIGFPSEVLTSGKTHISIFFGGIPTGALLGYFISGGDFNVIAGGALAGETLPAAMTSSLWKLSERIARGKIPHKDEYISGDKAARVLADQKEHLVQTSIQRELYSALQQQGTVLTPDQFLNDIYTQMPSVLVNKRKVEIERAKYPEKYTNGLKDEAFPKMVGVAQILQTANI